MYVYMYIHVYVPFIGDAQQSCEAAVLVLALGQCCGNATRGDTNPSLEKFSNSVNGVRGPFSARV